MYTYLYTLEHLIPTITYLDRDVRKDRDPRDPRGPRPKRSQRLSGYVSGTYPLTSKILVETHQLDSDGEVHTVAGYNYTDPARNTPVPSLPDGALIAVRFRLGVRGVTTY